MKKIFGTYFLLLVSVITYGQHKIISSLQVNTFQAIPKGIINNCGSELYKSVNDKKNHQYLVVIIDHGEDPNIKDDLAFIRIGNNLEKLTRLTSGDNKRIIDIYQNRERSIKLTIHIKSLNVKNDKELGTVKGILTIETSRGQKITFNFIGDTGC